jgi:hypothetical protein
MPTPLVKLNHAVAGGMATTPDQGLALVDQLVASGELHDYHLLHATRADLLRRLGRNTDATAAYQEALNRARTDVERRYLARRLDEVSSRHTRLDHCVPESFPDQRSSGGRPNVQAHSDGVGTATTGHGAT